MARKKKVKVETSSPKKAKDGCLCEDGTYSIDCCEEKVINQGVGQLNGQGSGSVNNVNAPRTITRN